MAKHVITKEEIARFNQVRENTRIDLTMKQLFGVFKNMGIPINPALLKHLTAGVKAPIVRIDANKYRFAEDPVHIERLQQCYDDYHKSRCACRNKAAVITMQPEDNIFAEEKVIQEAIQILKNAGYKIQRPVVTYEEV